MTKASPEELPSSWAALGQKLGVPQPIVSAAARQLLSLRSEGPLPTKIPSPMALGSGFVAELTQVITRTTVSRKMIVGPAGSIIDRHGQAVAEDRIIRACLDKHQKLLGDNLVELVADELSMPIEKVQKSLERRYKALQIERKIRQQEEEYERNELGKKYAKERGRIEAADLSVAPKSLAKAPEAPRSRASAPPTPSARPDAVPAAHVDTELDGLLQAAWIADRAGIPHARRDAVAVLVKRFPTCTDADAEAAINASYTERNPTAQAKMERRAARLASEQRLRQKNTEHG